MADLTRICINGDCSDVPSGGGGGDFYESITHSELLAKRNGGTLTPGMQYRITDYVCTTTQDESRAISHPFDIIVTADDESTLNENARACLHEGDTYYSASGHQADLEAWELKYCVDNDADRFKWADTVNGKGVIYWLKDDRFNECPYDFKQLQFKRYKITECTVSSLIGKYTALQHGNAITAIDENNPVWCYTFSFYDSAAEEIVYEDASIMLMDKASGCSVFRNVINPRYDYADLEGQVGKNICYLNNIVFFNTFGNNCSSNTFDGRCFSNTFGNNCNSNAFVDNCFSNTFGNNCDFNTFGNDCDSNKLYANCKSNAFGNSCNKNTLHNDCQSIAFAGTCYKNMLYNGCSSITFGVNCNYNDIGENCSNSNIGDNCYANMFEQGCARINLTGGTSSSSKKFYHILASTKGTSSAYITVGGTNDNAYVTYVGKNSSGVLKTWVPANLAP